MPGQADLTQHLDRPGFAFLLADPGDFQAERCVFQHAHVLHQGEGLEHHAHFLAPYIEQRLVGQLSDFPAIEVNPVGGGLDQAIEQAHHLSDNR